MKYHLTIILLLIVATAPHANGSTGSETRCTVTGVVTDFNHEPVTGATVLILIGDSVVAGTSTNPDGSFLIRMNALDGAVMKVSAIGFAVSSIPLSMLSQNNYHDVCLEQVDIPLPAISVAPEPENEIKGALLSAREISEGSRQSIVPSNPIAAIRSPQVIRRGSQHSSNLRVNGTSPTFHINGNKIGYDPNHYGAFSIVPGGIVDGIRIYTLGTRAKYGLPSVVELNTTTPFNCGFDGEANISVIASDGFVSVGKKNFFLTGSARKSVIDRLAKKINGKSERQTIPPTNFRDIFISSGVRLSPTSKIVVDAYQVRDFLSLESGIATGRAGGVSTNLHSTEWFASGRYEGIHKNWFVQGATTTRSSYESYHANSIQHDSRGLQLDLTERSVTSTATLDVTRVEGTVDFSAGIHGEYVSNRETDLHQHNWNFQPPDSPTDLPSLYQPQLNAMFGDYHGTRSFASGDGYLSLKISGKNISHEHGMRVDHFSNLSQSTSFSIRHEVKIDAPLETSVDIHFGTYAESPVNRILEPWQPIVRSEESTLQPIRTTLVGATIKNRGFAVGIFSKRMGNVPAVVPPLKSMAGLDTANTGRVEMTSPATQGFTGWDISYDCGNFIAKDLSFYGYYGHSRASRQILQWEVPHELDIPHRFFASFDYTGFGRWSLGANIKIQSGAPYTPAPELSALTLEDSAATYFGQVERENSMRLPRNISLNVRAQRSFSHGTLYFSVANVTNRENAIIHSYRGYIYDAGIMPSLGFSYRW
ncbi:MAG: carboxypeptidase regulatory-like domain-containing protein [Candidatus Zixiibacteriota bacterium]